MSTRQATEKGFWGLALLASSLCILDLAFRCVWFGLLGVLKATQTNISLKNFQQQKKIWKIWSHAASVRHHKGQANRESGLMLSVFPERVSLYRPGYARTHSIDQAGLELTDILLPLLTPNPPTLNAGLKACSNTIWLALIYLRPCGLPRTPILLFPWGHPSPY